MPSFPDNEDEAAEKKAIRDEYATDKSWIAGPHPYEIPETGDIGYLESEGEEPEPLKGRFYQIAYTGTMGGLYKDPMVGRPDVFAYFAVVGQYFFEGRTMSSTSVEKDREAVRALADELLRLDARTPGGFKYARLVKKRAPPEDLDRCHFSAWRIRKAGEAAVEDGEAGSADRGDASGDESSDSDFW